METSPPPAAPVVVIDLFTVMAPLVMPEEAAEPLVNLTEPPPVFIVPPMLIEATPGWGAVPMEGLRPELNTISRGAVFVPVILAKVTMLPWALKVKMAGVAPPNVREILALAFTWIFPSSMPTPVVLIVTFPPVFNCWLIVPAVMLEGVLLGVNTPDIQLPLVGTPAAPAVTCTS